jgi:hypothetical protein
VVAALGACALLAGCLPLSPAPAPPKFPGYTGTLQRARGHACKRVLVTGDSLAKEAGTALHSVLSATGRCNTVINVAVPGSSLGDWLPGHPFDLAVAIDRHHPDLVVMEHVGNEGKGGPFVADPNYVTTAANDAVALSNVAKSRVVPFYWAVPPIAAFYCGVDTASTIRLHQWKDWIAANAEAITGNAPIDWRRPFGGDAFSESFSFPQGVFVLRTNDCTHLTSAGDRVASEATTIGIQRAWTS